MDLMSTLSGSLLEGFFPAGWDLNKWDACCAHKPNEITQPQAWWHQDFAPIPCDNLTGFDVYMGHAIARQIQQTAQENRKLVLILPVGPMGMYKWVVYFLKEWQCACKHVWTFNMDEWSDAQGNTLPGDQVGSFQDAMQQALFNPLCELTVPATQRHFATREALPTYPEKIGKLQGEGGKLVTVYGIGRVCHIAFWEPHFAAEFATEAQWRNQTHRLGAKLHPLTIEQNAITSFKSRTTLVPCFANSIGPGLFLKSDYAIGGCDGTLGRGMMWQGLSLWVTLRHGPSTWIPSSFMPTMPGRLFFLKELAGPLEPECN